MAMPTQPTSPIGQELDEAAALTAASCLFRGLGDPTRLAILRHLALGEHKVFELTAHMGLAQSTVSAHLACLRGCGLVQSRPVGRASVFSLTDAPHLLELLTAAERLLAATGDAVVLCPVYGNHEPSR
jgi:DNA-binding transcriptional ArsR family regulator